MEMIRIYFTIYQLLVNFLLPGILMVACYSGFVIILKIAIQVLSSSPKVLLGFCHHPQNVYWGFLIIIIVTL